MVGTIPCIQIRSNCLIAYELPVYDSRFSGTKNKILLQQLADAKKQAYHGRLSEGAKKRLTRAIDLLVQSSRPTWGLNEVTGKRVKHTLSFITLTISNDTHLTGRQGYDLVFKHFLQWLRRTAKVTTYIWKAEVQQRGQLHYHITTPSFIHYQKIRTKWNALQQSAGITNEYFNTHGHYDPNSTDIKEVRKISDLSSYMKKEFCKSIQNPYEHRKQPLDEQLSNNLITAEQYVSEIKQLDIEMKQWGKLWDCSENLKAEKYFTIEDQQWSTDQIELLEQTQQLTRTQLEQCTVFKVAKNAHSQILTLPQMKSYDDMLHRIRHHRSCPPKKILLDELPAPSCTFFPPPNKPPTLSQSYIPYVFT